MYADDLSLLVLLVVVGSTIWVGVDASQRDTGSMGTASWVILCLVIWIVAFPMYLVKRGSYPHRSRYAPPMTPPGWYPDQHGTTRWWDGFRWTDAVLQPPRRDDTPPRGIPVIRP